MYFLQALLIDFPNTVELLEPNKEHQVIHFIDKWKQYITVMLEIWIQKVQEYDGTNDTYHWSQYSND